MTLAGPLKVGRAEIVPAATGNGLPDWAAKLMAGRRFTPPSHDLLVAEANGIEAARYALLRGEQIDLLLHVDPRAAVESLDRIVKGTDPGTTFRQGIFAIIEINDWGFGQAPRASSS